MKSCKLVLVTGIATLMCLILVTKKNITTKEAMHSSAVQQDSATHAQCLDRLGCKCCIPVNQPY